MDYLSFEDREEDFPALYLLALSLFRSSTSARLHIPARDLPAAFRAHLVSVPSVVLHTDLWPEANFWNIKPELLERLLERGCERITWLDADIVVTKDPAHLLYHDPTTIIVAQEGFRSREAGTSNRTIAMNGSIGRELGYTVNSCVVSVTSSHLDLLATWAGQLTSQSRSTKRHPLLVGDQDTLGGLLGSTLFDDLPVYALETGRHIAHDMLPGDYGVHQRLRTVVYGEPTFAHAQGRKTWRFPKESIESYDLRNQLAMHRTHAKKFVADLPPEFASWLRNDSMVSRVMGRIFPKNPSIRGLPIGIYGSLMNTLYRIKNKIRYRESVHDRQCDSEEILQLVQSKSRLGSKTNR